MHIIKFPWLVHREGNHSYEVYCVSVSPDGKRLASGGLDGKIRIWSIDTLRKYQKELLEKPIEPSPDECRELCSMSRHTGAVTCLKFSPNGRFLASGSDDKILLIWEKDEETTKLLQQSRKFGDSTSTNLASPELEHWTVRKRLVAHDNDIQDVAWAPDASILVSVGLDRSIIVWSGTTFEKIKRFDIHQSHVKGVVFDPANKYFVTCSDDRTMRIFRYRRSSPTELSFSVESSVTEPFRNTPLTTYYRRCSWSPDGQYIAAPNAVNGGMCSVAIVKRGSWESPISLLGHELPCEVCSFSPRLYEVSSKAGTDVSIVLVTCGQDRSLVLWDTMSAIPLVVARDIAAKTITDVTWDPSGQLLFLSSLDGSVTAVFFDEGELGKPIPLEQNSAQLHRYGADRESMYFPESVEQLKLEDAAKAFIQEHPAHSRMEKLMGQLTEGQQQQGLNEINASTTTSTTSVNTLIPRSKKHPNRKLPVTILQTRPKPAAVLTAATQTVRITKSGKKRVTPTLVSVTGNIAPKPQFGNQVIQKRQTKMAQRFLSRPSIKIPRQGLQTLVASVRDSLIWEKQQGKDDESESTIDHISEAQISNGKKHSLPKTQSSRKKRATEFPTYLRSSITTPFSVFTDMKAQPSVIIEEKSSEDGKPFGSIMEIRNECEDKVVNGEFFEEFDSIAKLFVTDGLSENPVFEFFKNEKVTNVTESEFTRGSIKVDYWAISTEKGSIILLSKTGRQLMPSLELGSSLTHLISKGKYVLAVTSNGLVYSWDIDIQKSVMEGISLAPLVNQFASYDSHRRKFENAVRIVELRLVDRGLPLVVLSNRHAFSFDVGLECWISVLEPWYFDKLGSKDVEEGLKFASGALRIIGGRLRKKQIDKVDENREVVKRAFVEIERCISERTVR